MNNQSIDTRSSLPTATQFSDSRMSFIDDAQKYGVSESFDDIFSSFSAEDDYSSDYSENSYSGEDENQQLDEVQDSSISDADRDEEQDDDDSIQDESDDVNNRKDGTNEGVSHSVVSSEKMPLATVEKTDKVNTATQSKTIAQTEEAPKLISTMALKIKAPVKNTGEASGKETVQVDVKSATTEKDVKGLQATKVDAKTAGSVKVEGQSSTVLTDEKVKPGIEIKVAATEIKESEKNIKPAILNLKNVVAETTSEKTDLVGKGLVKTKNTQADGIKGIESKDLKLEGEAAKDGKQFSTSKKRSVKTAHSEVARQNSLDAQSRRTSENSGLSSFSVESAKSENEIGIKSALQPGVTKKSMLSKNKSAEEKAVDKVFLKDTADANVNRPQAVTSRSDTGGSMNYSQSGNQDHGSANREFARQWIVDSAENRSTAQATQQSQFVDKTVSSQLSAHVLNQIVNHIEKMRESDKNRVKVSLGSGDKGNISVDIRIEDGVVYTSFEGDDDILDELKRDWQNLSDRASEKGVVLEDPEFISYSSPVENESLFPGTGIEIEEKSQSVIQHNDNKPVRPVLQTATSGSSGPVHSYA